MKEHARPKAFPEHLRPYLLPLPRARWEALFLLRAFADANLEKQNAPDAAQNQAQPDTEE
jgi:hypothetical protein